MKCFAQETFPVSSAAADAKKVLGESKPVTFDFEHMSFFSRQERFGTSCQNQLLPAGFEFLCANHLQK